LKKEVYVPMASDAKYLYMVMMDVEPEKEAEFNDLYNEEHLPMLLAVPGVVSAARYRTSSEGFPKYMAVYGLDNPDVPNSEAWKAAAGTGQFPQVAGAHAKNRRRVFYERVHPQG
jgi:antibiotic biosynthesis monooxygenase (ABM) superfamily enzyme